MIQNFVKYVGLFGAPFMMVVLILDKLRYQLEFTVDYGIVIAACVALLCLIYVLLKAKIPTNDTGNTYRVK